MQTKKNHTSRKTFFLLTIRKTICVPVFKAIKIAASHVSRKLIVYAIEKINDG